MTDAVTAMAHLLDDARVLDWSSDTMTVVIDGCSIEIDENHNMLSMRQRELRWVSCQGRRFTQAATGPLVALARGKSLWARTAEETLDNLRVFLGAHARLAVVYPPLMLDFIARNMDPALLPDTEVRVRFQRHAGTCSLDLEQEHPRKRVELGVSDPDLYRASCLMTRITEDYTLVSLLISNPGDALFVLPEPLPTAHAKMEHQALLTQYRRELEHDILPILGV